MRRSKSLAATLLATGAVVLPFGATGALAAPAQDPLASTCTSLGILTQPVCEVVEEVEALLAPAQPLTDPVTEAVAPVVDAAAPVAEALAPVTDAVGGALPAPVAPSAPTSPTPSPTPAPGSGSSGGTASPGAQATSSGSPTGFSAPVSSGRTTAPSGRFGSVPSAPSGFSLQLSPLGVPTLSIGSDFAAPALGADLPLPDAGSAFQPIVEAVRAGTTSAEESKATAAVLALAALGVAAGLLIDQARKSKAPFTV